MKIGGIENTLAHPYTCHACRGGARWVFTDQAGVRRVTRRVGCTLLRTACETGRVALDVTASNTLIRFLGLSLAEKPGEQ